jgi:hypothetical protein
MKKEGAWVHPTNPDGDLDKKWYEGKGNVLI